MRYSEVRLSAAAATGLRFNAKRSLQSNVLGATRLNHAGLLDSISRPAVSGLGPSHDLKAGAAPRGSAHAHGSYIIFNMISALLLVFGAAGFILVSRREILQHAQTVDLER